MRVIRAVARAWLFWLVMIAVVWLVLAGLSRAFATWSPDYADAPKEWIDWFNSAMTTPEARKRLGYGKCCDHSDRFKTKFMPGANSDEWFYWQDGRWKLIPSDVIHTEEDPTMPAQLRQEGVLFIYPPVSGQPTCFWPPETGG